MPLHCIQVKLACAIAQSLHILGEECNDIASMTCLDVLSSYSAQGSSYPDGAIC